MGNYSYPIIRLNPWKYIWRTLEETSGIISEKIIREINKVISANIPQRISAGIPWRFFEEIPEGFRIGIYVRIYWGISEQLL